MLDTPKAKLRVLVIGAGYGTWLRLCE